MPTTAALVSQAGLAAQRLRLELRGAIQGVGFRPFVYRLAQDAGLTGSVHNNGVGVVIEIEGNPAAIRQFTLRLHEKLPAHATITQQREHSLPTTGSTVFTIAGSEVSDVSLTQVMPDLATCPDCLAEIFDPDNRRFGYAFTTCTQCGPRYSVLQSLPYDRERTSMRRFPLCEACHAEYTDPTSRRFHAQSIACGDCGPQLAIWDHNGRSLTQGSAALHAAAEALQRGMIVALKGLGGFQLLADACNAEAVQRLRERKRRPGKPFALMLPTLEAAKHYAQVNEPEAELLCSAAAPIVLLHARASHDLATGVAPDNPLLGIMLPTTPLHHLLLHQFGRPLIATSGNISNESIAYDEHEALQRLHGIADRFLVHDRPIVRPVDDSVLRVIAGQAVTLRCARGLAPLHIANTSKARLAVAPTLAMGGDQKNAPALANNQALLLNPHIGDLHTPTALDTFQYNVRTLPALFDITPERIACDTHPDYCTTRFADSYGLPVTRIPHHLAHVAACMIDNELDGPVLGVAWDGTGYGADRTIWGGEFIRVEHGRYDRCAHLQPFLLPGGEAAMREPWRAAMGILYALYGDDAVSMPIFRSLGQRTGNCKALATMLRRRINSPLTSSAGRLFDACAALLGLREHASFEGEAAMAMEYAAIRVEQDFAYQTQLDPPVLIEQQPALNLDWRPMLRSLCSRLANIDVATFAAALHDALAHGIAMTAERMNIEQVVLTGGCFQNAVLTECTVRRLKASGFKTYWHRRIPPNDGGLATGQLAAQNWQPR